MAEVLSWVEEAFRLYAMSQAGQNPSSFSPMVSFRTKIPHSDIDYRAGTMDPVPSVCSTLGFGYWDNPKNHGLPSVFALSVLTDLETGVPLAIMDAFHLAFMRTGAAGAVASKYLARKNPKVLSFIGTGNLARYMLWAHVQQYGSFEQVRAWSRTAAHRKKFGMEVSDKFGIRVKAVDNPEDAVQGSDIVCSVTPSREPIVLNEWIGPGMHINAFGADAPGKQELHPSILSRAKIVVDSLKQCETGGEINKALAQGIIGEKDVHAGLGEIIAGWKKGRESDQEITVMDSTGLNALDIVTCHRVYEKALSKGVGTKLSL